MHSRHTLCELRNQRDTSKSMILVPLLNPKFAIGLAARLSRTSGSGHSRVERPRTSMLRKLVILAVVLAIIGAAVFWVVTIPATVPANTLQSHTPSLANGRTMFFAGGCASCHATPQQDDKTRLGGGFALK